MEYNCIIKKCKNCPEYSKCFTNDNISKRENGLKVHYNANKDIIIINNKLH